MSISVNIDVLEKKYGIDLEGFIPGYTYPLGMLMKELGYLEGTSKRKARGNTCGNTKSKKGESRGE